MQELCVLCVVCGGYVLRISFYICALIIVLLFTLQQVIFIKISYKLSFNYLINTF